MWSPLGPTYLLYGYMDSLGSGLGVRALKVRRTANTSKTSPKGRHLTYFGDPDKNFSQHYKDHIVTQLGSQVTRFENGFPTLARHVLAAVLLRALDVHEVIAEVLACMKDADRSLLMEAFFQRGCRENELLQGRGEAEATQNLQRVLRHLSAMHAGETYGKPWLISIPLL